jgi:hypothetical protein
VFLRVHGLVRQRSEIVVGGLRRQRLAGCG